MDSKLFVFMIWLINLSSYNYRAFFLKCLPRQCGLQDDIVSPNQRVRFLTGFLGELMSYVVNLQLIMFKILLSNRDELEFVVL